MRQSLRFAVLTRDGFRCRYCGKSADQGAVLQVDHIHPRARGGSNDMANLVTACWDCNIGKGANVLRPIPKHRRFPRHPSVALDIEPDPEYPWGSHCLTPLKIAAIGALLGLSTYRAAWKHAANTRHPNGRLGRELMPPLRKADEGWWIHVGRDPEPMRIAMTVLEPDAA